MDKTHLTKGMGSTIMAQTRRNYSGRQQAEVVLVELADRRRTGCRFLLASHHSSSARQPGSDLSVGWLMLMLSTWSPRVGRSTGRV